MCLTSDKSLTNHVNIFQKFKLCLPFFKPLFQGNLIPVHVVMKPTLFFFYYNYYLESPRSCLYTINKILDPNNMILMIFTLLHLWEVVQLQPLVFLSFYNYYFIISLLLVLPLSSFSFCLCVTTSLLCQYRLVIATSQLCNIKKSFLKQAKPYKYIKTIPIIFQLAWTAQVEYSLKFYIEIKNVI